MAILQGASPEWMQSLLEKHFADTPITVEDIQEIEGHASIIDWPRLALCECTRCRSPYMEHVSLGTTIIITTATNTYTAYVPNPDEHLLEHKVV